MSEEITSGPEQDETQSEIVHDDIMKRLLEYQRQLREGIAPDQAAVASERRMVDYATAEAVATKTETDQLVDLTSAEAAIEAEAEATATDLTGTLAETEAESTAETIAEATTSAAAPREDLQARVAELEGALAQITRMIGDLRNDFRDTSIAADERLAAIDGLLRTAGGSTG